MVDRHRFSFVAKRTISDCILFSCVAHWIAPDGRICKTESKDGNGQAAR